MTYTSYKRQIKGLVKEVCQKHSYGGGQYLAKGIFPTNLSFPPNKNIK